MKRVSSLLSKPGPNEASRNLIALPIAFASAADRTAAHRKSDRSRACLCGDGLRKRSASLLNVREPYVTTEHFCRLSDLIAEPQ
jgi:hypothetical protein